jgi:hypothetical protein
MNKKVSMPTVQDIPRFDRRFFESENVMSRIGGGVIGGKASGLAFAHRVLQNRFPDGIFEGIEVSVPRLVVIGTDVFDAFMKRNDLYKVAFDDIADDRIANAFQRAEFPAEYAGDLRGLITSVKSPLAIRSSSMLEDAMYEPFAGVYETKMTPNNQPDIDTRYKKLVEGIKFVYASTFFREAKAYSDMTGHSLSEEKMGVIIQEVVGRRFDNRFYPSISGVGRSFNFYSFGHARPEDGVVDLALGLGKTIVDGGLVWTYCPEYPNANPPFTTGDLLKNTQTEFWTVNMGKPSAYDPIHETEYLAKSSLKEAEYDGTLVLIASTYQPQNDRIVMGIGADGPRILNFAPIIRIGDISFNDLIKTLLSACSDELSVAIEIEFAVILDPRRKSPPRFGLLQVRPMVVSDEHVEVADSDLRSERALLASERVLGNGVINDLSDIVYVKPDTFQKKNTRAIASEIDDINQRITAEGRRYVLIGFGRWGSSDPWLGIPVNWGNISGVQVLVEATLSDMNVELSQGSHFFHNLTSLQLCYFSVSHTGSYNIDWKWLDAQETAFETNLIRHVKLDAPLLIKVDGRLGKGAILR